MLRYELFAEWLGWWHRGEEVERDGEKESSERTFAGMVEQWYSEKNAICREHWHALLMIQLVKGQHLRRDESDLGFGADAVWEFVDWDAMCEQLGKLPKGEPGGRGNEHRDLLIGDAISALYRVGFEAWDPSTKSTNRGVDGVWGIPVVAEAIGLKSSHLRRVWSKHHKRHGYIVRLFEHDYWPEEVRDRLRLDNARWPMHTEGPRLTED